jgi:hypothetical protein
VAAEIHGVPVAAALFEPNVISTAGPGLMMLAIPFDWRRQDRAIRSGAGLAPTTLLVVTARNVYAFDAGLLSWNVVREIAVWARDDLVARAVSLPAPHPPRWAELPYRPHPALRLENRAGAAEAEVRPIWWGDDAKEVFRVLTGFPGWPPDAPRDGPQ